MAAYTIQDEATRIFRSVLLTDSRLEIPDEVREAAERTSFDPSALSKPLLPAPVKCTESSAALVSVTYEIGGHFSPMLARMPCSECGKVQFLLKVLAFLRDRHVVIDFVENNIHDLTKSLTSSGRS